MSEKPIIFSGPMVRAILDGRKTQTRRVMKPQPFADGYYEGPIEATLLPPDIDGVVSARFNVKAVGGGAIREQIIDCPYVPGMRIWVREAWMPAIDAGGSDWRYAADYGQEGRRRMNDIQRWRSPIHMPRWASRLTLAVTEVRAERVQEISEADAMAEGVRKHLEPEGNEVVEWSYKQSFARLWNDIHGRRAWDKNPWVCRIAFEGVA